MMGLLRSWKLWLAVALIAGVAGVGAIGLKQARTIGEQQAEMNSHKAVIEGLGYQLNQQQRLHGVALSARDAALEAERAHARNAQARAEGLSSEINQARANDAEIDACLGMPLPTPIADRLRQ